MRFYLTVLLSHCLSIVFLLCLQTAVHFVEFLHLLLELAEVSVGSSQFCFPFGLLINKGFLLIFEI